MNILLTPSELIAIETLKPLLKVYGLENIDFTAPDRTSVYPTANSFAEKVLSICGLTFEQIVLTVYNISPSLVKADYEGNGGWHEKINWYTIYYAVCAYATMVIDNDKVVEVGMKYPEFNKAAFIKKFKLSYKGLIENKYSIEMREKTPSSEKREYDVYTDPQGNIYSFPPDGMGKGGYCGFIFNDATTAYNFVIWFLNSKTRYVKAIDYITNRLDGLRKCDLTAINSQMVAA